MELGPIAQEWWDTAFAQGYAKGLRRELLRILAQRFPDGIPAVLTNKVQSEPSAERLDRWFDVVLTAVTAEEFWTGLGD